MFALLRVALPQPQVLFVKSVAAWPAACSQAEGASSEGETEAEAETVKAWKSIDQLS